MNKINEMIEKCTNQVEYKFLWEITIWNKKFKNVDKNKQQSTIKIKSISASKLKKIPIVSGGNVRLISTGNFDGFTLEDIVDNEIYDLEIITLPEGGNANIKYWNGKFINALNLLATSSNKNKYNTKYIYYFLLNNQELINSFYNGSGVKHPQMFNILNIQIPIPPLEVQNEIVKILDKYTELEKELEKELELRKQQYEYYRNKLLNKTGGGDY